MPKVVYIALEKVIVYQLSEGDFEKLAAGPAGQLHLNFALAMLPTALSIFITLQTGAFTQGWSIAYQIACWCLAVQGIVALIQWWRANRSYAELIQRLRDGRPPKPIVVEQLPAMPTLPLNVEVTESDVD